MKKCTGSDPQTMIIGGARGRLVLSVPVQFPAIRNAIIPEQLPHHNFSWFLRLLFCNQSVIDLIDHREVGDLSDLTIDDEQNNATALLSVIIL